MNRGQFIPTVIAGAAGAMLVDLVGCAQPPGSPILTPGAQRIVTPQAHGITPAHKWHEYNIGRFTLIGPFEGQRVPTVYYNVLDNASEKLVGSMTAVFGHVNQKVYLALTLALEGKSVTETFYDDETHILKWTEKHPIKAFRKLFKTLLNENNKASIALLTHDGSAQQVVIAVDGNDGTLTLTDYSVLYKGKPLTATGPWIKVGDRPQVSAACYGAQALCLIAFLTLIQGLPAATDPAGAAAYAAAVGLFGVLVEQTEAICAQ